MRLSKVAANTSRSDLVTTGRNDISRLMSKRILPSADWELRLRWLSQSEQHGCPLPESYGILYNVKPLDATGFVLASAMNCVSEGTSEVHL